MSDWDNLIRDDLFVFASKWFLVDQAPRLHFFMLYSTKHAISNVLSNIIFILLMNVNMSIIVDILKNFSSINHSTTELSQGILYITIRG